MAHYAKVINGFVVNVIVADSDFMSTHNDGLPGDWIQTSYNTHHGLHWTRLPEGGKVPSEDQSKALRYNYAQIGGKYDYQADAFIPYKMYDNWVLDTTVYDWVPPVPKPDNTRNWSWDDVNIQWVELTD